MILTLTLTLSLTPTLTPNPTLPLIITLTLWEVDVTIGDTRFVQRPLGYPRER